ncbi:MAG TPA: hypothetical protein VHZ95_08280, partial [Polyangiales bacterium]|nr:hypothetical protein [Polyangiales bacterium]
MPGPSPLVGYNTNVRHKGKLYHIQTEDSGVNHPHVITHLFADGGRIIASRKTGYSGQLGAKDLQSIVKKLMQEQHKAMFIELRDCVYDEEEQAPIAAAAEVVDPRSNPALDSEALDRAAEARLAASALGLARGDGVRRGAGRYQPTVPANPTAGARPAPAPSIFGADVMRGKSLDEVILSYLSDDVGEG